MRGRLSKTLLENKFPSQLSWSPRGLSSVPSSGPDHGWTQRRQGAEHTSCISHSPCPEETKKGNERGSDAISSAGEGPGPATPSTCKDRGEKSCCVVGGLRWIEGPGSGVYWLCDCSKPCGLPGLHSQLLMRGDWT